jgi:hypothetical protein
MTTANVEQKKALSGVLSFNPTGQSFSQFSAAIGFTIRCVYHRQLLAGVHRGGTVLTHLIEMGYGGDALVPEVI